MFYTIAQKQLVVSVVLWLCVATQAFAQRRGHPHIDELVGPVRSLREWDAIVSRRAGTYSERGRKLSSSEAHDRARRLLSYTFYSDAGRILYGDKHTYDLQGRLAETRTVHSEFVYLPDLQIHVYDERGKLIEVKGFNSGGTQLGGHLYRYDLAGDMIEERNYAIGKNEVYPNTHLVRHVYDANGHETSREQYVYDDGGIRPNEFGMGYQKEVFQNDKEGRPVVVRYFKSDNSPVRTKKIKYDRRGNTVDEIETSFDSRLLRKVSWSYVFDHHGNWIKQTRREWTAESVGSVYGPSEVSYRSIRYYASPYQARR